MRRPPRPAATHGCPGGCGAPIARHRLSCPADWFRLPRELRNRINAAYRRDPAAHLLAVSEALEWYRNNPRQDRA